MIQLLFVDDYERALARLSELADEATISGPAYDRNAYARGRADAYASAFEAIAAIRPRIERTVASDLAEDR